MKIKYISILSVLLIIASFATTYLYLNNKRVKEDFIFYKNIEKLRIDFITSLPIYDDYASIEIESKLRKHLLKDHIDAAKQISGIQVNNDSEIEPLIKSGFIVSLEPQEMYFFYNVKKKYRYLRPSAKDGLLIITERFQKNLKKRKNFPVVKIAISSALRPVSYNSAKMKKNLNVSPYSTHSYGVSFDIFYDEYFVDVRSSGTISPEGMTRTGFLMGGYFRRQFRAVLTETLIELQDEGLIYVILEKKQRCYHVTPLKTQ